MTNKKVKYVEPEDYIPKSLRKEFGLGEYAEKKTDTKKTATKEAKETKKTK